MFPVVVAIATRGFRACLLSGKQRNYPLHPLQSLYSEKRPNKHWREGSVVHSLRKQWTGPAKECHSGLHLEDIDSMSSSS